MATLTERSGLITAVAGGVSYALTQYGSSNPQDAGIVAALVAVITAFISFEKQPETPAPVKTA